MTKGKLFVISGPSGAGKGTICRRILEEEKSVRFSVSMTTREPREGEEDKVHYHFVKHEAFEALIAENGFMEYANVFGNYYGTPKKQVMEWLEGGSDVILEIDVQGALQIKKSYPQGVLIFILPPSLEELKCRILGRGSETEASFDRRFGEALKEISQIGEYEYRVVNDDLQKAVDCVKAIIVTEHCKLDAEKVENIISRYKED